MNKKKAVFIILALVLAGGILTFNIIEKSPQKQADYAELYKEARTFEDNGEYRRAYYLFSEINPTYKAYDAVLFHQAICASKIEDEQTAINKLAIIATKIKPSPLTPVASYNIAQAQMRIKDYESAEAQFNYVIQSYPDTDYELASHYYLGLIYKKKLEYAKARDFFYHYIKQIQDGRFSYSCVKELESLQDKGFALSDDMKLTIAKVYFNNEDYYEALAYLKKLPFEASWILSSNVHIKLKNKNQAYKILKKGILKHSVEKEIKAIEKACYNFALVHPSGRYRGWLELERIAPSLYKALILYNKATLMSPKNAMPIFGTIWQDHPDSFFASESLWNVIWYNISNKHYKRAILLSKQHIEKFANTNASPKVLFWLGKIFEKRGDKPSALGFYSKAIELYGDDYYAYRSRGRINALNDGKDAGWAVRPYVGTIKLEAYNPDYSYKEMERKFGTLIAELFKVKDYATLEFITHKDFSDDVFMQSWLNLKIGYKTRSALIAREEMKKYSPRISYEDKRWQLVYPMHFLDKINHYAQLNRVNPAIILAIMKVESHFNEYALSSAGARGLMQIMPATAKNIARQKGYQVKHAEALYDPDYNIKLGSAYIKSVTQNLKGNHLYAVGAYNAGPNALKRWEGEFGLKDLDEFIENIPYPETKKYIKKVFRALWNYQKIYKI